MILKKLLSWIVLLGLSLIFVSKIYAIDLGQADSFSILSSTYTNTSIGTNIGGDVGYTTGPAVVPTINGSTYTPPSSKYTIAGIDQGSFLSSLNSQTCTFTFGSATDLSLLSQPLSSGVYCVTGAMSVGTGGITLLSGDYLFRSTGALNTVANSSVTGGTSCNINWTPGGATTMGANSSFMGTIIDDAGVTIGSNVSLAGKVLSFGGTVSTDKDTITTQACLTSTATPTPTPTTTPTTTTETITTATTTTETSTTTSSNNQTPVCVDNNTIKLPANLHVIRNGSDATVNWFQTEGNMASIYYRQLNEKNWTHAVGDISVDDYMSYTIHLLKPKMGYIFGVEQKWNCSGGQMVTAIVIDGWQSKVFNFSYWEWSR